MAKPIEPTPVLQGADAERFVRETFGAKYSAERERLNEEAKRIFQKHRPR